MLLYNYRIKVFLMFLILLFSPGVYADEYIDETGRKVNIPPSPKRIVSLAPSITETLFALGLDEEIVGVTTFSDYPEAAKSKTRVGSYVSISLEKVVSLNPDLIIGTADGNKKETIEQLERIGFPVYMINPASLEEIFEMVLDIGRITGRDNVAKDLVRSLRERVSTVVSQTACLKKPRIFFQIGIDPIVTVGRDTLHNKLITLAGGINISGNETTRYPRYSIEEIIVRQPEIIVVSSMKRGENFELVRDKWKRWKNIPAVKNNRIYILNTDLTDHPSPRIVDGLEELAKIIHPGVPFKNN
ncbi:MAG: cobalamin-binding protein [Syntrophales bacterium]|nr:cobalamin-binding protein [Syntrophales bacterium]